jgi:hypothetical protein
MPTAVITFIGSVAGAIVTGLTAVGFSTAAAVTILDIGIKLAALAGLAKLSESLFGEDIPPTPAENFQVTKRSTLEYQRIVYGAENFQVTKRSTLEYQRIVYGETLMSGPIVYLNSAGDHNQNLSYAIALAGHEVSSITDMWINDIEIPFANITYVGNNGNVTAGDFFATGESALSFAVHLGEWTSSHRGRGIAYITATCRYVEGTTAVWSAGAPNNIKALVAGKKVYDPRSDSTQSFGTGPHRLASSLTWEYNDNPALCWADYMIDSELGFGEDSSRIDYGYVASAAEACEVTVNNPTGVTPLTDNRWRCSGTLSTGDTYEANICAHPVIYERHGESG